MQTSPYPSEDLLSNIHVGQITQMHYSSSRSNVIDISYGFTLLTSYTYADLTQLYQGDYTQLIAKQYRSKVRALYSQDQEDYYQISYPLLKKDGSLIWVMESGRLFVNNEGSLISQSILMDITAQKNHEEALRISEERFRIAIHLANDVIFEVDLPNQRYTYFENAEKIFGISGEQILKDVQAFSELDAERYMESVSNYFVHPDDHGIVAEAFTNIFSGEETSYDARMKAGNTKFTWCRISVKPIMDAVGAPIRMIGHIKNIQEIKEQEDILKRDPFTGLYNKTATASMIDELLTLYPHEQHGLFMIDVDNFKYVNDTFGHAVGDQVLLDVSEQLKKFFRKNDIIGRIGGDEFLVFMPNISDKQIAINKAEHLIEQFSQNYRLPAEYGDHHLSLSIGIALSPDHGRYYQSLFSNADQALYQSKSNGKNRYTIYQCQCASS